MAPYSCATTTIAADPTGPLLAVGDDGGCDETAMGMRLRSGEPRVTLLDAERGEVVGVLEVGGHVHQLAWDPWRGRIIAATYGDVEIWTAAGEPVRRFRPYESTHATTFTITERWLATAARHAYNHATLDVWDAATLERLASVDLPGGIPPRWIAATPDGRTLLTPRLPEGGDFGIQPWSLVDD
jgi:YD repeat-containing protein